MKLPPVYKGAKLSRLSLTGSTPARPIPRYYDKRHDIKIKERNGLTEAVSGVKGTGITPLIHALPAGKSFFKTFMTLPFAVQG